MAAIGQPGLEVQHPRCCGLDVHKKSVMACVITEEGVQVKSFPTMTADLERLARWLDRLQVRYVAMESTGVYWIPVYNVLERNRRSDELLVANARHIKAVPGRKTDIKDAEWIATLLRYGMLRGSRIPDREQRELRELLRQRTRLIDDRAQVMNRLHKLLEGANIKLSSVAADLGGVSAMEMLTQLVEGNDDPAALAQLARGRMRSKIEELEQALTGTIRPHHRLMLASYLRQLTFLDEEIAVLDAEAQERMRPFGPILALLQQVPGVGERTAQVLIAELGTDMSFWATAAHLASWAKLCPGNNQSGGKRRRAPTGHGNRWLCRALIEAARAGVRTKGSYLGAQYRRLKGKGQGNDGRAIVAVAHTILTIVYHMLRDGTQYQDLGADYFESRDRERTARRAVATLQRLGYQVTLEEAA